MKKQEKGTWCSESTYRMWKTVYRAAKHSGADEKAHEIALRSVVSAFWITGYSDKTGDKGLELECPDTSISSYKAGYSLSKEALSDLAYESYLKGFNSNKKPAVKSGFPFPQKKVSDGQR